MLKRLAIVFCCVALVAALPLIAGQWDKATKVTFSAPVELPTIVLPAGTYVFKLADVPGDRHVVEVFNAEETHIYATILAIPNARMTATADTVLRFEERPKNTPEAIRAWFYPGDNFGQEFVYPRVRGAEIAAAARVPVLTAEITPSELPEDLINAPVEAVMPAKPEVALEPAPAEPLVLAEAEPAPLPFAELPKTASPVPFVGLGGICIISLGGLLRTFGSVKR